MSLLFGFLSPSPIQLLIVGAILLLLFGSRLPSVMRSLGRSVVEFKKGVSGEDEIEDASHAKSAADHKEKENA